MSHILITAPVNKLRTKRKLNTKAFYPSSLGSLYDSYHLPGQVSPDFQRPQAGWQGRLRSGLAEMCGSRDRASSGC